VGLPVIRITLYGIDGREKCSYVLKPDDPLVIKPRPLFTVERIVVEAATEQLELK
jgi:hypothetical protein